MKFFVELRLKASSRNKAMDAFELRGPNRNPRVALRGAWVATGSDLVFAVVESDDESMVEQAARSWSDVSSFTIHAVVEIEQF
jgi:hypothetical protein